VTETGEADRELHAQNVGCHLDDVAPRRLLLLLPRHRDARYLIAAEAASSVGYRIACDVAVLASILRCRS